MEFKLLKLEESHREEEEIKKEIKEDLQDIEKKQFIIEETQAIIQQSLNRLKAIREEKSEELKKFEEKTLN